MRSEGRYSHRQARAPAPLPRAVGDPEPLLAISAPRCSGQRWGLSVGRLRKGVHGTSGPMDQRTNSPRRASNRTMRRLVLWTLASSSLILQGCSRTGPQETAPARTSSVGSGILPLALRCSGTTKGFELALASPYGGRPTPASAATWSASHHSVPGFALPTSGWHAVRGKTSGVNLRSDGFQIHVVQGPDGTWQVDSGYRCGE